MIFGVNPLFLRGFYIIKKEIENIENQFKKIKKLIKARLIETRFLLKIEIDGWGFIHYNKIYFQNKLLFK